MSVSGRYDFSKRCGYLKSCPEARSRGDKEVVQRVQILEPELSQKWRASDLRGVGRLNLSFTCSDHNINNINNNINNNVNNNK